VAPLVKIKTDPGERQEQAGAVAARRMQVFLAMIKNLPEAILFLPTKRLTEDPWRWAPDSFLNSDWKLPFADLFRAECTKQGLVVNCDTIRVLPDQTQGVGPRGNVLRLRQKAPRGYTLRGPVNPKSPPLKHFGFQVYLDHAKDDGTSKAWSDYLSTYDGGLCLLQRSCPLRRSKDADAVLVRLLGVKDGMHFGYSEASLIGELEPTKVKWCVG
jgi:hypothetical protein